jgi:hypothetical protein
MKKGDLWKVLADLISGIFSRNWVMSTIKPSVGKE